MLSVTVCQVVCPVCAPSSPVCRNDCCYPCYCRLRFSLCLPARRLCLSQEGYTSQFLEERGISEQAFYTELQAALRDRQGKPSEGNSESGGSVAEIMAVLDEVADFRRWADSMRHQLWLETPD